MKYKFKKINIVADSIDDFKFPPFKERIIEKRGQVIEFTLHDVEQDLLKLDKLRTEMKAQLDHENAKVVNIEHFHPFVKEMSEQDLSTAHLYYEAKAKSKLFSAKLEEVEEAYNEESAEVEEIKKQIPELNEETTQ